ncbi:Uncharacterised protein [Mycobacteroides abscessus subsp. abscessus]|nr:Uncharacterised protein [Mycobacteroides abscessus subsp. abscessus]
MGLVEQLVGLIHVQFAKLATRPLAVPVDHRRAVRGGGRASAGEDYLGDRLPVDGHGNSLPHTHIAISRVIHRESQRRDIRAGSFQIRRPEFGLGVLVGGVGKVQLNVQCPGLHIGVGGQALGVHPPNQTLGLGLFLPGVLVVPAEGESDTTHPITVGLERAIADGVHPELDRVPEERLGQGQKRCVPQGHRIDRERRVEAHGEGDVIHDVQPAHLCGPRRDLVCRVTLEIIEAVNIGEEAGGPLGIGAQGGVVPGIDVGLGGDRFPVVERPPGFELDRPVDVVVTGDGFGHPGVLHRSGLVVELDQRGE